MTRRLARRICERILQMNRNLSHVDLVTTEMVEYVLMQAASKPRAHTPKRRIRNSHWLIISPRLGPSDPIGCCSSDDARADVLQEEPDATFQRVAQRDCRVCKSMGIVP